MGVETGSIREIVTRRAVEALQNITDDVEKERLTFDSGFRMVEILHNMISPVLGAEDLQFFNNTMRRWQHVRDQIDQENMVIVRREEDAKLEMEITGEQAW